MRYRGNTFNIFKRSSLPFAIFRQPRLNNIRTKFGAREHPSPDEITL